MTVKLKVFPLIVGLIAFCSLSGCSQGPSKNTVADTPPTTEKPVVDKSAPKKVEPVKQPPEIQTAGAFTLEGTRVLWALGRAAPTANKDPALIRLAADMRARDALARMIAGKTYTATGQTAEGKVVHKKTITNTTLKDTRITDRWVDPQTGEHFSVAVIPLAKSGLAKEKAELLFNKLNKELPAPPQPDNQTE